MAFKNIGSRKAFFAKLSSKKKEQPLKVLLDMKNSILDNKDSLFDSKSSILDNKDSILDIKPSKFKSLSQFLKKKF